MTKVISLSDIQKILTLNEDIDIASEQVKILVEGGRAIGVEAKRFGRTARYYGNTVVLSAGTANVELLRQAGIRKLPDR